MLENCTTDCTPIRCVMFSRRQLEPGPCMSWSLVAKDLSEFGEHLLLQRIGGVEGITIEQDRFAQPAVLQSGNKRLNLADAPIDDAGRAANSHVDDDDVALNQAVPLRYLQLGR